MWDASVCVFCFFVFFYTRVISVVLVLDAFWHSFINCCRKVSICCCNCNFICSSDCCSPSSSTFFIFSCRSSKSSFNSRLTICSFFSIFICWLISWRSWQWLISSLISVQTTPPKIKPKATNTFSRFWKPSYWKWTSGSEYDARSSKTTITTCKKGFTRRALKLYLVYLMLMPETSARRPERKLKK